MTEKFTFKLMLEESELKNIRRFHTQTNNKTKEPRKMQINTKQL